MTFNSSLGVLSRASTDGVLPRVGRAPEGVWRELVQQVAGSVAESHPENLVTILLRGSAARGTAMLGVSDLDFVIVTAHEIERKRPLIEVNHDVKVELGYVTHTDLMASPKYDWLRFSLAYCAWDVCEGDYLSKLDEPVLSPIAAGTLLSSKKWLAQFFELSSHETTRLQQIEIRNWIIKRTIRSLAEPIFLQNNLYSRDLAPCINIVEASDPNMTSLLETLTSALFNKNFDFAELVGILEDHEHHLHDRRRSLRYRLDKTND